MDWTQHDWTPALWPRKNEASILFKSSNYNSWRELEEEKNGEKENRRNKSGQKKNGEVKYLSVYSTSK